MDGSCGGRWTVSAGGRRLNEMWKSENTVYRGEDGVITVKNLSVRWMTDGSL